MGYLTRVPSALTAFASNSLKFRAANAKYINHLKATTNWDEQTTQKFSTWYCSYFLDEKKALVVSDDLPMSRAEFTEMLQAKEDIDRMSQPLLLTAFFGGATLPALPIWASSVHKLPSTFFSTEEEIKAAGVARDLEVHLKFAPQAGFTQGRFLEYFVSDDARLNEAYDSITHGFTLPKDAAAIRKMGQHVSKKSTCALQFVTSEIGSWHRDQEHYDACAFLGKPFLFHSTESLVSKTIEHYRNLFQEDALIKKEGVASLSDFELYRIANRRLIARWEEELTRAQLEARLADWFTVTEVKEGEEKVPLRVIIAFQASYFRDPGFLEESLEILDQPGFASPLTWAKDAFERRVEFETGADAEAIAAHVEATEKKETEALEARKKYLESL